MKSDFTLQEFFDLCSDVTYFIGDDNFKLAVGGYK
jgi:hypothetical protein